MIVKEVYVDEEGIEHPRLVHIYSDLGVRLFQVDTNTMYRCSVIDTIDANHTYIEMLEDLGELDDNNSEDNKELAELAALLESDSDGKADA